MLNTENTNEYTAWPANIYLFEVNNRNFKKGCF